MVTACACGETAAADTLFLSPSRADTMRFVVAPSAPEVAPGGTVLAYLRLEPPPRIGLPLSFRFLVRYDPALLTVNPVIPITIGTLTQNGIVFTRLLRPGVVRFDGSFVPSTFQSANLAGIAFRGVAADSSRPVRIEIDSAELTAGCPSVLIPEGASIDVCQCRRTVPVTVAAPSAARLNAELRVDLRVADTAFIERSTFIADVAYDPSLLEPIGLERTGTVTENATLAMTILAPGSLQIESTVSFDPSPSATLCGIVFRRVPTPGVERTGIRLPTARVYARCCPAPVPGDSASITLEGICERFISPSGKVTINSIAPQPVRSRATVEFTLREETPGQTARVRSSLLTGDGRNAMHLSDAALSAGRHSVKLDAANLPAGAYFIEIAAGDERAVRRFVVVR